MLQTIDHPNLVNLIGVILDAPMPNAIVRARRAAQGGCHVQWRGGQIPRSALRRASHEVAELPHKK